MNLTDRKSHFEFGENWRDYAKTVDRHRIHQAVIGLQKLFPDGLSGQSFLDIGCGSGLHSLAAILSGASPVTAVDIDENSVETTRQLLDRLAPGNQCTVRVVSVFDLTPEQYGRFDIVYSWGVLHHTGDMWRAIGRAAEMVKPGGEIAIAIYATTKLDAPWTLEKRFYSSAPTAVQWAIRQGYMAAWLTNKAVRGYNPITVLRQYHDMRGMNFSHDAHDWLGGYPYQTASADDLRSYFAKLDFEEVRAFALPRSLGLFGSGCHEFVFRSRS